MGLSEACWLVDACMLSDGVIAGIGAMSLAYILSTRPRVAKAVGDAVVSRRGPMQYQYRV